MKVLVTGGAGFIGSHTVDRLIADGHQVRILDCLKKPVHLKGMPPWINPEAEFILGDVQIKADLVKALEGVDAVYHLAAYQDYLPDLSTFFHTNAVSTAMIYEIIVEKNLDIKKVIVASSQFVQGEGQYHCPTCNTDTSPLMRVESDLINRDWEHRCKTCDTHIDWTWTTEEHVAPPNAYALSKHSQEQQAITFGERYGFRRWHCGIPLSRVHDSLFIMPTAVPVESSALIIISLKRQPSMRMAIRVAISSIFMMWLMRICWL